MHGVLTMTQL